MWQLLFKVIEDWNDHFAFDQDFYKAWQLLFKVIEDWNDETLPENRGYTIEWQLLFKVIEDWNSSIVG